MSTAREPALNRGSSAQHKTEARVADEADFNPFFERVLGIAAEEVTALAAAYRTRCDILGVPLSKGMTEEVCALLEVQSASRSSARHTS